MTEEAALPRGRAAFVMAHNRQELLNQTLEAIRPQVDTLTVLDNASEPPLTVPQGVGLMYIPDQPPNLAKWWNIGLDFVAHWYSQYNVGGYDVALLCDDAIVPEGWFTAVTSAMRETGTSAGSSSPFGQKTWPTNAGEPSDMIKRDMDGDIMHRMCSWAFIVAGESKVRADESMHWWFFDTCFDIQCRRERGTVLISTHPVPNQQPNHYTNVKPHLAEQAGRDRATFAAKYGRTPW